MLNVNAVVVLSPVNVCLVYAPAAILSMVIVPSCSFAPVILESATVPTASATP